MGHARLITLAASSSCATADNDIPDLTSNSYGDRGNCSGRVKTDHANPPATITASSMATATNRAIRVRVMETRKGDFGDDSERRIIIG